MTILHVNDLPKMLRETLCVAQTRVGNSPLDEDRKAEHVYRLQRLINECDRHRPLGPDGKHGDRHTETCGCELPSESRRPQGVPRIGIAAQIFDERDRQDASWGEQNHPDGTGGPIAKRTAELAREICQGAAKDGRLTWTQIMREEVSEAFAEVDPAALRDELIQVAAVAVAWVEAIDRRAGGGS